MIRKGLKPGLELGFDRPDDYRFRRVFPFKRSWVAIAVLMAFATVFMIPAVTIFKQALTEWGRFKDIL